MSLYLQTNIAAYKASNRLQSHYSRLSQSVNRLSSGKRLNSSADSPVDMAVHNIHKGRISVLGKGKQNLNDAISMVQTAESAMAKIDELLIQMKEIASQSATGTYSNGQREILSSEFGQLASEIDRISRTTQFKGIRLLDGSLSSRNNITRLGSFHIADKQRPDIDNIDNTQTGVKIHFGTANNRINDYYFIRIGDLSMDGLLREFGSTVTPSSSKIAVSTQHSAQVALETINSAIQKKESSRYIMGIMQNRLSASIQYLEDEIMHLENADSRLTDLDFAKEMTNYTSLSLMSQATTAILAQANTLPNIALKLLNF
ncbi:MAG: flagellin [Candidatus Cloacimonetes bacterium]|jgi:flagellin|nr:flagellin [Candidatus Cloacimonadota bacterium]MDD4155569.1 flagellin [Candidatus Cloacimonadota bacterium]